MKQIMRELQEESLKGILRKNLTKPRTVGYRSQKRQFALLNFKAERK